MWSHLGFLLKDPTSKVIRFGRSSADIWTEQVGGNNQNLANGSSESQPTLPQTALSGLEDPTFKVTRLSPEERKEKIHRYIKKRNERNFSKKIKVLFSISVNVLFLHGHLTIQLCWHNHIQYACRKTLADNRPRVRGRFAKNDELCEAVISSSQHHEHYEQIVSFKAYCTVLSETTGQFN
jgi:hypothetical protein